MMDSWETPFLHGHEKILQNISNSAHNLCNPPPSGEQLAFRNSTSAKVLQDLYVILTPVMSVMSVIGSILIFYCFYAIPELRNKARRLLIYLTISDLMIAVGNLVGIIWLLATDKLNRSSLEVNTNWVCRLQAAICSGFSIASFFWTTFIATNALLTVVYSNKALVNKYEWVLHLLSWGAAGIVVLVTFCYNRYGYDPCSDLVWWCWVTPKRKDASYTVVLWQLFSGKAWEMISYVIVCIMYAIVKFKLTQHMMNVERKIKRSTASTSQISYQAASESSSYLNAQKKLTYIPLAFMIGRIWGSVRFILDLWSYQKGVGAVAAFIAPLQGVGDSSQGFFNFLILLLTTPQVRDKLKCCARHRGRDLASSQSNMSRTSQRTRGDNSDTTDDSEDEGNLTPHHVQHD